MSIDVGIPDNIGEAMREAMRRLSDKQEAYSMPLPASDEELLMSGRYAEWDVRDQCDEDLYWAIITQFDGIEFDGGSIL
jgi:hypothetical protein